MSTETKRSASDGSLARGSMKKRIGVVVCGLPIIAFLACGDGDRGAFAPPPPPLSEPATSEEPKGEPSCVESFAETRRAVDIIISIDQSGSMIEEIDSLKNNVNNLPKLLAESNLDYRVIMVAQVGTGQYDICVPPPLGGPDCGPNGDVFRPIDHLVTSNDSLVVLLRTLRHPVEKVAWHDFLRPGVLKVFVPITDDESTDIGGPAFDAELLRRGAPLFGTPTSRNYVFFPVIGVNDYPDTTSCPASDGPGREYQHLANITSGRWFSVCRPSLAPVLDEIANAAREAVSCEVAVPEPPAGATLDFSRINVRITPPDGEPVLVPQDPAKPCGSGAEGWQFSEDKKKILLCGSACSLAKSDPGTKFTVGFGCNTEVR